jgi:DNA-binding CsgD family transcriptional regulator
LETLSEQYSEETMGLAEERVGHGILLMTVSGRILLIDSRADELCQRMRVASEDQGETLPPAILKMVSEIAESLESLNHLKDWEAFGVRRVIEGAEERILVSGIGLPARGDATERRILLTLDVIIPRTSARRLDAFDLTPRETTTVKELLKGSTNKEIAQAMGISEQTTKEHIKHIMEKTTTSTRTGIIMAVAGPQEMVMSQPIGERLPESQSSHRRPDAPISCTHPHN